MDQSPESFERLLKWLHPNRDEAGQEYQRIRALLTRKFRSFGYASAEKLVDATIDRVAQTLTAEMIENWAGPKERYFHRVGYYILLEERDRGVEMQMPEGFDVANPDEQEDLEPKLRCLEKCLRQLSAEERELIDKYYRGTKAIKIRNREELAQERNLSLPLLRVRAFRIRKELRMCIVKCVKKADKSFKT